MSGQLKRRKSDYGSLNPGFPPALCAPSPEWSTCWLQTGLEAGPRARGRVSRGLRSRPARAAPALGGAGRLRRRSGPLGGRDTAGRRAERAPVLSAMRPGEERPVEGGVCAVVSELELLKLRAAERIDEAAERLGALSRAIWSEPELAYEEHHAHRVLTRFFEREPPAASWAVQPHYQLATAFRAEWEPPGPRAAPRPLHLGFLCEYDALPGIGHACGHNLIAEVGAAAALGLKGALEGLRGPPPPVKVRWGPGVGLCRLPRPAPILEWQDRGTPCASFPSRPEPGVGDGAHRLALAFPRRQNLWRKVSSSRVAGLATFCRFPFLFPLL